MRYLTIAFVFCGLATNLSADIAILNPNFNVQVLGSGDSLGFGQIPITDWTQNDVPNTAYTVYNPSGVSYPGGVPGGNNVADLLSDGATASISQILSTDLQANDTYTLTGYAGFRLDTNIFAPALDVCTGNVMVEAGGNMLNSLVLGGNINNGATCASIAGTFTPFSIAFTTGANPAGLGQPLEIVLEAYSGSTFEPGEIDYTGLALSDSNSIATTPEPSSWILLTTSLGALLFFRRPRRRAQ
jgi:hypothetical protein